MSARSKRPNFLCVLCFIRYNRKLITIAIESISNLLHTLRIFTNSYPYSLSLIFITILCFSKTCLTFPISPPCTNFPYIPLPISPPFTTFPYIPLPISPPCTTFPYLPHHVTYRLTYILIDPFEAKLAVRR